LGGAAGASIVGASYSTRALLAVASTDRHDRMRMSVPAQTSPSKIDGATVDARSAPAGEVRFVTREEAVRLRGALEAARLLFVQVDDLGAGTRGRLAEAIDEAVERALRDRGAAPPGIAATSDAGDALADQLYRTRQIGRVGLAIDVGALSALVDARGSLEPEDGGSIRFFAEATRDRPVVLLLDAANAIVRTYGAPMPLAEALGLDKPALAPTPSPTPTTPSRSMPSTQSAHAMVMTPTPAPVAIASIPYGSDATPEAIAKSVEILDEITRATPLSGLERAFVDGYAPLRTAMLEDRLGAAGVGRAEARAACEKFSSTFARSYGEAVRTFGVTGRHPRMGFELFDLAQRCARVHGARATHVLLVDALRYDLGKRLRHRLGRALARKAVCVEEHALWAVLPTTTVVQLDAMTRGEDALRAPATSEKETSIVRGRSLDVLRRTRIGHRDVLKLDLLEGRLRDQGLPERDRLDALSAELAPILGRAIETAPMRTLVVVAGDHGFTFDAEETRGRDDKSPTPPAMQGGASPDEVFVPFTAWLVGGVH
jgi:hypothetical protein